MVLQAVNINGTNYFVP